MLQSRIRRGEMDKKISFIKKVIESSDSNEDYVGSWEYIASNPHVQSRIRQLPASEVMIADRLTNIAKSEFVIDGRTDLNTRMRIVYKTRCYDIVSITEHEMSRERYQLIVGEIVDTEFFT
jgi:head-tail adaptor